MPSNQFEARARTLKACAIGDALREVGGTADVAASLDEDGRRAAERVAGVRPASDATWVEVIAVMRDDEARRTGAGRIVVEKVSQPKLRTASVGP